MSSASSSRRYQPPDSPGSDSADPLRHTAALNLLAHLHLARFTPGAESADPGDPADPVAAGALLVGNLLPDLTRGRPPDNLHPQVLDGWRHHQRVDRLTDSSPHFLRSRRALRPHLGQLAPIAADVLYDHLLIRRWARFSALPLGTFCDRCYTRITDHLEAQPPGVDPRAAAVLCEFVTERWLDRYRSREGLAETFDRMSRHLTRRFRRDVDFTPATPHLPQVITTLQRHFDRFYPELIQQLAA